MSHSFTHHRGYVAVGADLINGSMTIGVAQELCNAVSDCMAITMNLAKTDGMLTSTKYHIYLKASAAWDPEPSHLSLIKVRTQCAGVAYRPWGARDGDASAVAAPAAGRGPYCCEGSKCPREDEYSATEMGCLMPASSPLGVPRCYNLLGDPLPNLALASTGVHAAISSDWGHSENAGVLVAIDGRNDGRYFHTQCDGKPQWFNLTFPTPVVVHQVRTQSTRH